MTSEEVELIRQELRNRGYGFHQLQLEPGQLDELSNGGSDFYAVVPNLRNIPIGCTTFTYSRIMELIEENCPQRF